MLKLLLTFITFLSGYYSFSQTWSDPIILYSTSFIDNPNFTIDRNGVIHCVWAGGTIVDFRKIYYSKSTDNGFSWSPAIDISLNTSLEYSDPHIVSDTFNNLYVCYVFNVMDPEGTMIYSVTYDGNAWTQPQLLSIGLPGSRGPKLTIDRNNRIYCFWHIGDSYNGTIFYRYFKDGSWSDIIRPYNNTEGRLMLSSVVADRNNTLHCIGNHNVFGVVPSLEIYFTQTNDVWSDFTEIDPEATYSGNGYICLNTNDLPSVVFGRDFFDSIPLVTGMLYSDFNGSIWLPSEIINLNSPEDMCIAVDSSNNTHIVNKEKVDTTCFIIHYLNNGTGWEREIVQQSDNSNIGYGGTTIILRGSYLYLLYVLVEHNIPGTQYEASVVFQKLGIPIGIGDNQSPPEFFVYPNPITSKALVNFNLNNSGAVKLSILDMLGRIVYEEPEKFYSTGKNTIGIDITTFRKGLYFLELKSACIRHVQKISVIKN